MAHCSKGAPSCSASVHHMGEGVVGQKSHMHMAVVEVLNSGYSKDKDIIFGGGSAFARRIEQSCR